VKKPSVLLEQLWSKFRRDSRLPVYVLRRKAARYLEGLALSPLYLRHCDSVGKRARTRGAPFIENLGRITIGDDFNLVSIWVQSHLVTGHQGSLAIGNSVNINFGAAISAHESVSIGDRVRIGPYSIIMDSDYHSAADRDRRPTSPIVIEEDAWLAGRVSVLKGSRIGRGAVVTAGSVVSGIIPAGVIAGGVPARVLRKIDGIDRTSTDWMESAAPVVENAPPLPLPPDVRAPSSASVLADGNLVARVKSVIASTFSIDGEVDLDWGPKEIPKWDSMGQLRLTLALEEQFKIAISEDQLVDMLSVGRVCTIVQDCVTGAREGG
jgi:maltose O-acetyltransferase